VADSLLNGRVASATKIKGEQGSRYLGSSGRILLTLTNFFGRIRGPKSHAPLRAMPAYQFVMPPYQLPIENHYKLIKISASASLYMSRKTRMKIFVLYCMLLTVDIT